jgi:hypothetical protein
MVKVKKQTRIPKNIQGFPRISKNIQEPQETKGRRGEEGRRRGRERLPMVHYILNPYRDLVSTFLNLPLKLIH